MTTEQSPDERMARVERMIDAMASHHELLAQQIGEIVVTNRELAARNAELATSMSTLEQRIPELMAAGIVAAVSNPATWAAGRDAMRRQARDAAGNWLLGLLRFAADKALWLGLFFAATYWVGGWPAVAAMLKLKAAEK